VGVVGLGADGAAPGGRVPGRRSLAPSCRTGYT